MELREYLSSDEYILGIIRNVDVDYGKFKNIAITNKRFILFNTKKKRSLFKTQEIISKASSVAFANACGLMIIRERKNYLTKRIEIKICERLTHYRNEKKAYCDKRGYNPITLRRALPFGPTLEDVSSTLLSAFDSIAKKILSADKNTSEGDELIDVYAFNTECVEGRD